MLMRRAGVGVLTSGHGLDASIRQGDVSGDTVGYDDVDRVAVRSAVPATFHAALSRLEHSLGPVESWSRRRSETEGVVARG